MRLFLDTNVVLDFLDARPTFDDATRLLMMLGYLREFEVWMSASQTTDLFYVLSNGGRASQAEEAKRSIRQARRFIRVCSLTEADVDEALDSSWTDFEDACVYQCALRLKADAIITRNQKDFAKSSIKVFGAAGLFAYLEQEKGLAYDYIA
ncbi:type II toxin-antitoxin system VapC family toxin [Xiamenia xianingshaonis]|uniref:PIN domain-containing protein n=1 Tax=Xiamenia xianingshaonis TaxID=2682776 RepID=A0A9E6MPN9_9ACTN|nr:PIN domain-containing protein [Xiamenia xianingshaonis]NHM13973.1 PIN domain-containing protein [Xiamenia xianingshaonis]QTU83850.1 PIN domain-containing protein [Xiamenia xianingshaonis]